MTVVGRTLQLRWNVRAHCPQWHPPKRGTDTPRAVPGEPVFCEQHTQRIRDAISGFDQLYVQLHLEASYGTPKPTRAGKITSSNHSPSPAPRADDADELARWCCELEDSARRRLHAPASTLPATSKQRHMTAATSYLWKHHKQLLAETAGGYAHAFGLSILNVDLKLRRRIGWDDAVRRLDVPCPACDMLTLKLDDGADHVRCSSCRNTWPELEYERLALVLASELA